MVLQTAGRRQGTVPLAECTRESSQADFAWQKRGRLRGLRKDWESDARLFKKRVPQDGRRVIRGIREISRTETSGKLFFFSEVELLDSEPDTRMMTGKANWDVARPGPIGERGSSNRG